MTETMTQSNTTTLFPKFLFAMALVLFFGTSVFFGSFFGAYYGARDTTGFNRQTQFTKTSALESTSATSNAVAANVTYEIDSEKSTPALQADCTLGSVSSNLISNATVCTTSNDLCCAYCMTPADLTYTQDITNTEPTVIYLNHASCTPTNLGLTAWDQTPKDITIPTSVEPTVYTPGNTDVTYLCPLYPTETPTLTLASNATKETNYINI